MLRSAYRTVPGKSPWLSFDPQMQSDCSAMYRAYRLVLFALFVLFSVPGKARAASNHSTELEALQRRVDQQQRQIDELKAMIRQQGEQLRSQQQAVPTHSSARSDESNSATGASAQAADGPKRDSVHVKVKRDHAPPTQEVKSGFGSIKLDGLLQAWFSGGNLTNDTLRLRRAELKFSGEVIPKINWLVMIDPAKALSINNTLVPVAGTNVVAGASPNQATRVLQDAFVTVGYLKHAQVDLGQFKVPLSLEGYQSPSTLDTVERALFLSDRARGGALGDVRDTGLVVRGAFGSALEYQTGVFNGLGERQNDLDRNDEKALAGRLVFKPAFFRGLQIGSSGAWADGNGSVEDPYRNRLGAELLYQRGGWKLKSELMSGNDAGVARLGSYGHVAFRAAKRFEPVFRFDYWDPDTSSEFTPATVIERDYLAGFNLYLHEHNAKLQFNYVRKTFAGEIAPDRNLFLMNLQTAW